MIIPVRCFTCGKVLADKYDYYVSEAQKISVSETNVASDASASNGKGTPNTGEIGFDMIRTGPILDKLGLTRYCCRRHMISHVDLIEII